MITLADALRFHVQYTVWATARLLNEATALSSGERQRDFGTADKSIEGTLLHIFRSERMWLARIVTPHQLPQHQQADDTWAAMLEKWPALHESWTVWAGTLTGEAANTVHEYHDLKGNPRRNALWTILLHVVNHSTHHRGQVSGFLRALGRTPPSLDEIGYARELGL